jgi:hypothetical protein
LQELKKWRKTLEKAQGYTKLEIDCQQIKRCIQIGLICVNSEWKKRPTITKIIKMLRGLESLDCSISNEGMPSADQVPPLNAFVEDALFLSLVLTENIIIIQNILKCIKNIVCMYILILKMLRNTTASSNLLLRIANIL